MCMESINDNADAYSAAWRNFGCLLGVSQVSNPVDKHMFCDAFRTQ